MYKEYVISEEDFSYDEVVRCKYCIYFKSEFWCDWWEGTTSFNDYCSKGERKDINE